MQELEAILFDVLKIKVTLNQENAILDRPSKLTLGRLLKRRYEILFFVFSFLLLRYFAYHLWCIKT
jgi:hypothetical protein